STPNGWVKPTRAVVSWEPALSADGPLSYEVILDGRVLHSAAGAHSLRIGSHGLGDGAHRVQLLAIDIDGQATLSAPDGLRVDGRPPTLTSTLAQGGRGVRLRVRDGASGVNAGATRISFGDGHSTSGRKRVTHLYAHAGVYRIVAHVRDRVGNSAVVRRLVSVR
ncbi:MAG TPA: PKD domain-containing protein, partial [Solirubrobacteraceae bacterium]|nr:PKD domain-containing protein [Solirubrobacteraceae bacterium]